MAAAVALGTALAPAAQAMHLPPGSLAQAARAAGIHFGAALDVSLDDTQRERVTREFTSATIENALKWGPIASAPGVYDFTRADEMVGLAEDAGMRIRGHTLFWSRLNGPPSWLPGELAAASDPAARLTELMQQHASTVVGRYAGRLAQWDVVNEPLAQGGDVLDPANVFVQTLGESFIDVAFAAAHAADPTAQLFLNETLTEAPRVFEGLVSLVERLLARGVPIHGVGLQSHYLLVPPDRAALQAQMERIAALGLTVELTEVDIPLYLFDGDPDPLAAQARAYADLVAACLAVPACTGITVWGVDDRRTWLDSFPLTETRAPNRPLLFDESLRPKPAYDAVVATLRAVPEPGTAALLGAGLAALAGLGRPARRAERRAR